MQKVTCESCGVEFDFEENLRKMWEKETTVIETHTLCVDCNEQVHKHLADKQRQMEDAARERIDDGVAHQGLQDTLSDISEVWSGAINEEDVFLHDRFRAVNLLIHIAYIELDRLDKSMERVQGDNDFLRLSGRLSSLRRALEGWGNQMGGFIGDFNDHCSTSKNVYWTGLKKRKDVDEKDASKDS